MKEKTQTTKRSFILRFLDMIEVAGNKLPTPLTIFFYLAVFVVVLSGIGAAMGWSATGEMYNSGSGTVEETTVTVVSLFSISGLQYMLTSAVTNFTSYAPLGFTVVIMLGIGVAESVNTSIDSRRFLNCSFAATPKRCSSSMMTRPKS